jgi:hypothetical protein
MANSPYTLFTLRAAGPSLTAGTAASMLIAAAPAAGQVRPTIPSLWSAYGTMLNFRAAGVVTTAATPGTGTWDLRIGSAQVVATSGAITLAASATTWPWMLDVDLVVRSEGATTAATCYGTGAIYLPTSLTAWTTSPITFGLGASGFDSTVPNVFDAFFTESLGTATMVCQTARLLMQNPGY